MGQDHLVKAHWEALDRIKNRVKTIDWKVKSLKNKVYILFKQNY